MLSFLTIRPMVLCIHQRCLTILFLCATVLASSIYPTDNRTEAHVFASKQVGEAHGKWFDDAKYINREGLQDHRRIVEMFFRGCGPKEHFDQLSVGWRDNTLVNNEWVYAEHGGYAGRTFRKLYLQETEYITEIHLYTYRAKVVKVWPFHTWRTRIGRIVLFTSNAQVLSCGSSGAPSEVTILSPKDSAFLYFSGSSGSAIDALVAHFIPVADF